MVGITQQHTGAIRLTPGIAGSVKFVPLSIESKPIRDHRKQKGEGGRERQDRGGEGVDGRGLPPPLSEVLNVPLLPILQRYDVCCVFVLLQVFTSAAVLRFSFWLF